MEQSATNKILCPYCGSEMKIPTITNARWVIDNARLYKGNMTCTNPDCAAVSPTLYGYDLPKLAERITEAALKRFKPLQKPLPWAEVIERGKHPQSIVWIETGIRPSIYMQAGWYEPFNVRKADLNGVYHFTGEIEFYKPGLMIPFKLSPSLYEKEFRCWATKPTDEERQAAKWME